ncbi:tRNA uridine-5-carboxymethylaminomethyl(34) synthesis GTPase MnmE [Guggenheimella bovis]
MDIISAISTGLGQAAIGIVRLSGTGVGSLVEPHFTGARFTKEPRKLCYGYLKDGDELIDEVMVVYLNAPKTYTGEDMVEIYSHGGKNALTRVQRFLLKLGARSAERGEFSERAVLNGRMNLTQAEAVHELITGSESAFSNHLKHLKGDTLETLNELKEGVLFVLSKLALAIDYPEETDSELTEQELKEKLTELQEKLEILLRNAKKATIMDSGLKLAIVGKPNVGKSSLLNALLGRDRAIVTDIAGTTRDTVEDTLLLGGYMVRVIDTAGIRETDDQIERFGVERSLKAMDEADIVILLLDSKEAIDENEKMLMDKLKPHDLIVHNKADLLDNIPEDGFYISAKDKKGITELEESILSFIEKLDSDESLPLISNERQLEGLRRAKKAIDEALEGIDLGVFYDYIEVDMKEAYNQIGFVLGERLEGDVIKEVFARFCVGK